MNSVYTAGILASVSSAARLLLHFLKLQSSLPQQPQGQHVAEVDFLRLVLTVQPGEAIVDQAIVDDQTLGNISSRNLALPPGESLAGRCLPGFHADIFPHQLLIPIIEHHHVPFAGFNLPPGASTASGSGGNVVRH